MAGGIDWFRWHHGSVTDPKFQLVARQAGASLPDVLAVWAYILEHASAAADRGTFGDVDSEAVDCLFGFPATETRTADILAAMERRALTADGRIVAWDKRQPKRERPEDDTAAQRKRDQRAREAAAAAPAPEPATPEHVTPGHATSHQKTPRGEESREEKREDHSDPNGSVPATLPGSPAPKPKVARKRKPADTPAPTAAVWDAYSAAYEKRYGVAPVRNASVNGKLAQFVTRVPVEEAPDIAAHFLGHKGNLYVNAMHPVDLLLRDAEKLRTEWLTNRSEAKPPGPPVESPRERAAREKVYRMTGGILGSQPYGAASDTIDIIPDGQPALG